VLGFAVAALPIAILFSLTSPGLGGGVDVDLASLLGLTGLFYIWSMFFTVIFGWPLLLLLRRFSLVRWWTSALAGLVIGAVVEAMIISGSGVSPADVKLLSVCGAVGAASGLIFWAIWRVGNPTTQITANTD